MDGSQTQLRTDFYACLTARVDALFELTDAVLCTDGAVRTLVGLSLPRCAGGRLVLAVDVSARLRLDAATSPDRLFCHVYGPRAPAPPVDRRRP